MIGSAWSRRQPLAMAIPSLLLPPPPAKKLSSKRKFECVVVALSKQGQRFLTSLVTTTDMSAANRLIKKFVGSSPKSIVLDALSHLLSPHSTHPYLSPLAFPMYLKISEAAWFEWNPQLVAQLVGFLDKRGQYNESTALVSESISRLQSCERDLVLFYCYLIDCHSKHNSVLGFDDAYACLYQLVCDSTSVYVKRQGYKAMISGLCELGRPNEAEGLIGEMRGKGVKASLFEFRCVLYGYGRLGLFEDMQRWLHQMESEERFEVDTVCSNMILSSYGAHNALSEMVLWLQKMKDLGIPFSVRTWNSVLNSCPTIMSLLQKRISNVSYPVSIKELMEVLSHEEAMLVRELAGSASVLNEAMKWDALEGKLDLHGMHLGSAYLIMLQWMEEMRNRLNDGKNVIPAQITVVCGSGNHSSVRGESPVKHLVKKIMVQMRSPIRIDRKNIGCFVAKGKPVKEWLC